MEAGGGEQLDLESGVLISDLVEEHISGYSIRSREISYGEDISTSSRMMEIEGGGLNTQGAQTVTICWGITIIMVLTDLLGGVLPSAP